MCPEGRPGRGSGSLPVYLIKGIYVKSLGLVLSVI